MQSLIFVSKKSIQKNDTIEKDLCKGHQKGQFSKDCSRALFERRYFLWNFRLFSMPAARRVVSSIPITHQPKDSCRRHQHSALSVGHYAASCNQECAYTANRIGRGKASEWKSLPKDPRVCCCSRRQQEFSCFSE